MNRFLCVALPGVLAQFGEPLTLYNGASPANANCAAKTSACDCHYTACSLSGDCACGWDDATATCKAGIPTKCVSCPSMRRCSVNQRLTIGPNGFPVPGQLSVWGGVPYPDQSGTVGTSSSSSSSSMQMMQPNSMQMMQPNSMQMMRPNSMQMQPNSMQMMQPNSMQMMQPTRPVMQVPAQFFGQPLTSAQPVGQPVSLYQNNVLSALGCTAKTNACDCHYASCTETGDCACGWDVASQTCRAGIPTACASCPSMQRCGTVQPLKIGPNGFPVPGQLSVWQNVPYPDQQQTVQTQTPPAMVAVAPAVVTVAPVQTPAVQTPAASGKGKAGKAGKGKGKAGKAVKATNQTETGL